MASTQIIDADDDFLFCGRLEVWYFPSMPPEDEIEDEPRSVEGLSEKFGLSAALIRLAIDCGCPAPGGKLTCLAFGEWLTTNYALVRTAAGLPACSPETASDPAGKASQQVKNSLLTIADFHASRLSDPVYKEAWRDTSEFIGRHDEPGSEGSAS